MIIESEHVRPSTCPFTICSLAAKSDGSLFAGGLGYVGRYTEFNKEWELVKINEKEVVNLLQFSPDEEWIFAATSHKRVLRLGTETFDVFRVVFSNFSSRIIHFFFKESRNYIHVFEEKGVISKIRVDPSHSQPGVQELGISLTSVAIDSVFVKGYLSTSAGKVLELDLSSSTHDELTNVRSSVHCLCLTSDDNYLFIGADHLINYFDINSKKVLKTFTFPAAAPRSLAIDKANSTLLIFRSDGKLEERDIQNNTTLSNSPFSNGCYSFISPSTIVFGNVREIDFLHLNFFNRDVSRDLLLENYVKLKKIAKKAEENLEIRRGEIIRDELSERMKFENEKFELETQLEELLETKNEISSKLEALKQTISDKKISSTKCITCYSKVASVWFGPCNHLVVCQSCSSAQPMIKCPLCKNQVSKRINIKRIFNDYPELNTS